MAIGTQVINYRLSDHSITDFNAKEMKIATNKTNSSNPNLIS
jgi:hypothetical protein